MIPAVVNGVPLTFIHPSGNVKSGAFAPNPALPFLINGTPPVLTVPCMVLLDGSPTVVAVTGLQTAVVKINGMPLVVVGSVLTAPSGHVATVLPTHGAGPLISVL